MGRPPRFDSLLVQLRLAVLGTAALGFTAAALATIQLNRQHLFTGMRQFASPSLVDQKQGIVIPTKGGRPDVAHQQRHAFADALGRSVGQQVMAFGRKTDAKKRPRKTAR